MSFKPMKPLFVKEKTKIGLKIKSDIRKGRFQVYIHRLYRISMVPCCDVMLTAFFLNEEVTFFTQKPSSADRPVNYN